MKLRIRHETRYDFDAPVSFGLQQLRKTPKSFRNQKVLSWDTIVTGGQKELSFEDHYRNVVELISFAPQTEHVSVVSEGIVEIGDTAGVLGVHEGAVPLWLYKRETELTRAKSGVADLIRALPDAAPLDRLHALSELIRERVPY
ncbi:MAG: transglutaminase family protein, partial [Silicimonas sp.]|nr:transglutaminase family protein [Silicimonas sp.]